MRLLDAVAHWGKKRKVAQSETLVAQAQQVADVGIVMSITEAIQNKKAIKTKQVLNKAFTTLTRMAYRLQGKDPVLKGDVEKDEKEIYEQVGKMAIDGLWGGIKYVAGTIFGAVFSAIRLTLVPLFTMVSSILVQTFSMAARFVITNPTVLAVAGVAALGYALYRKYWGEVKEPSVMGETGAISSSGLLRAPPSLTQPGVSAVPRTPSGTPLELYEAAVNESGLARHIAKGESGGAVYEAANRFVKGKPQVISGTYSISTMTIAEIQSLQAQKKIFAVGKYQMTPETLGEAIKKLNIDTSSKFDAAMQEKLFSGYLLRNKRPAVYNYITGKLEDTEENLRAAGKALAQEWRALADPDTGVTYGGTKDKKNKASVPWSTIKESLQRARQVYTKGVGSKVQAGTYTGAGFFVPASGTITSPFGSRVLNGKAESHPGIDIAGPVGTPIYAAWSGRVALAGSSGGYGNLVVIEHGQGITTLYGHNNKLLTSVGAQVGRGQVIAEMGSTGYSTGPHLHFEVRDGGKAIDPVIYVPQLSGKKGSSVAAGYGNTPPPEREFVKLNNKVVEVKS